jgi:hypothetical protein
MCGQEDRTFLFGILVGHPLLATEKHVFLILDIQFCTCLFFFLLELSRSLGSESWETPIKPLSRDEKVFEKLRPLGI